MLDINLIVERPGYVAKSLAKKNYHVDFTECIGWVENRRQTLGESEQLKAEKNTLIKELQMRKQKKEDFSEILERLSEIKKDIGRADPQVKELTTKIHEFLIQLPNMPDDDVVGGGKENNKILRTYGQKPGLDFEFKDHMHLAKSLDLIDYQRGAKMGGHGFWVYKGKGAILEWALLNYFISEHLKDGYTFLLPPHILNQESGYAAGQFPKFADDVFALNQPNKEQNKFLLPTAETALVNYHRDEILQEESLPRKYFAYTPCYRKEAGSYRTEEKGMIRGHQFNKVEMFQYTKPEASADALQELLGKAEKLVQGLELHYQLTLLAAEDCSAAMRKTYDVEVWIPSMNGYKEVTSASNAGDYQARRGNIKFKKTGRKAAYVHTLNASGLATSRILPALLEQHQNEDGSVTIPKALHHFTGFETLMAS
ncbi:MAG: serine--tRNA ligase [Desulfopila sp.]